MAAVSVSTPVDSSTASPSRRLQSALSVVPSRFRVSGRAQYSEHRPLRVLVVDSQEIVYFGFRLLLAKQPWVERCMLAPTMDDAARLARRYEPHVALVDMSSSGAPGPQVSAALQAAHPAVRVVLMSAGERLSTPMAIAAGACGVVSKSWPTTDLALAVQMVGMGMTLLAQDTGLDGLQLSRRERDVIGLIAGGATNREIGATLHLSPNTVKQHASALYRKLDVRNRAEAVRKAQQMGLIT